MSKLLLISDIHLLTTNPNNREDDIVKTQWDKLSSVYRCADSYGASVIQAGDFVDSPRSWILLKSLIDFLSLYPNVSTYFILGQHDMYLRSSSLTVMGVLTRIFPNVNLLTSKPCIVGDVALVGQSYTENSDEYPHIKGKFNVLVVHKPITNKKLPYNVSSAKKFLKKNKKFDCILCGDIHRKFHITLGKRHILNTSSLIRKTKLDSLPGFCVLDTDKNRYEFRDVPVEDNVFIENTKEEDTEFLDEFVDGVKGKSFFKFTPKEKVLSLLKTKNKSIRELALSIMEGE